MLPSKRLSPAGGANNMSLLYYETLGSTMITWDSRFSELRVDYDGRRHFGGIGVSPDSNDSASVPRVAGTCNKLSAKHVINIIVQKPRRALGGSDEKHESNASSVYLRSPSLHQTTILMNCSSELRGACARRAAWRTPAFP